MDWEEEIVTRNYVLSDFVTKTAYFCLAAAAFGSRRGVGRN